jgi:hypothetical protein
MNGTTPLKFVEPRKVGYCAGAAWDHSGVLKSR